MMNPASKSAFNFILRLCVKIYGFFKTLITPLVLICKFLNENCMSGGELTTKPLWDFFLVKPFTLFKLEYFQVSGLYDPEMKATYSFKMPVVIWNTRYDLHGTFVIDPIGMLTQLFNTIWKFVCGIFGFDAAGALAATGSLASGTAALGKAVGCQYQNPC